MSTLRDYYRRMNALSRNGKLYLLSTFVSSLGISIYALFFNLYILSLGYSEALVGVLVALPALVVALAALPSGYVGDRVGHRRTMLLGGLFIALSLLGVLLFTSEEALILFTVLYGLGVALSQIIGAPFMIENSAEEERTYLFSVQFALIMIASLFGSILGGALAGLLHWTWDIQLGSPYAYQGTLLVAVALTALALWPLWQLTPPPAGRHPAAVKLQMHSNPGLLVRLLLPNALIGLGAGLLIPFLNVFFRVTFQITDLLLGLLFAGGGLATAIATLTVPLLAQRLGRIRTLVSTQLASLPFLILMGFSGHLGWAALGYLARGVFMPMASPLYSLFVMEHVAPEERATVNGISAMVWSVIWAAGSWTSGYVQIAWGFNPLFLATTAIYLVGTLLIQLYFSAIERQKRVLATVEAAEPSLAAGTTPTLRE
jgi:MFS family permease